MTPEAYKNLYDIRWNYEGKSFLVRIEGYFANSLSLVSQLKFNSVHEAEGWLIRALSTPASPIPSLRLGSEQAAAPPLRLATDQPEPSVHYSGTFAMKTKSGEQKTISAGTIHQVFKGKGSPSEIREVLWAATHAGQIVSNPSEKGPKAALPQDYADMYLGVDCSGFVMNYLNPNVVTTIQKLDQDHEDERRETLGEIQAEDVMCFCHVPKTDYHHIALVSGIDPKDQEVMVEGVKTTLRTVYTVESNGGTVFSNRMGRSTLQGISPHFYVITPNSDAPGVFWEVKESKKGKYVNKRQEFYFQPAEFRRAPKM